MRRVLSQLANDRLLLLAKSCGTVFWMTLHRLRHWQCFGENWKHIYFGIYIWTLLCSLFVVVVAMVVLAVKKLKIVIQCNAMRESVSGNNMSQAPRASESCNLLRSCPHFCTNVASHGAVQYYRHSIRDIRIIQRLDTLWYTSVENLWQPLWFYLSCCQSDPLVHGPDPENLVIGTFRGDNFYRTFFEKLTSCGSWKNPGGRVRAVAK